MQLTESTTYRGFTVDGYQFPCHATNFDHLRAIGLNYRARLESDNQAYNPAKKYGLMVGGLVALTEPRHNYNAWNEPRIEIPVGTVGVIGGFGGPRDMVIDFFIEGKVERCSASKSQVKRVASIWEPNY